jgi:LmbE family N-acetylglucosaminyl deacetylase
VLRNTTAVVKASYPEKRGAEVHLVSKLYYFVGTPSGIAEFEAAFGKISMTVDNAERDAPGWAEWSVTTRIDTEDYWLQAWEAISCHRSQLPNYAALALLPDETHRKLWGNQKYYRVFSLVKTGKGTETDLFEGLR